MNWLHVIVWGFLATVVLTTMMAASQGAGITRMNLLYMLGTIFTPDRDKAKVVGFGLHFLIGWIFAFIYAVMFFLLGGPTWWMGAIFGFVHASFVLAVGMSLIPAVHPRMAGETQGPTITKRLEPPGFLGLHYGYQTPITVMIAHVVYGALLGFLLRIG